MSSTNRNNNRIDQDKYYTPTWCIDPMLKLIDWENVSTFLEPCAGDSRITNRVNFHAKRNLDVMEYEIDYGMDFLRSPHKSYYDVCVTNPPYSLTQQFIERCYSLCNFTAMLLRVNFLGSQSRNDWWAAFKPTNIITLSSRPSFAKVCSVCKSSYRTDDVEHIICCDKKLTNTTDSIEYAWFVWDKVGYLKNNDPFQWIKRDKNE